MKKLSCVSFVLCLLSVMTFESVAQSNTMVRFRISYGTKVLGNIDVELFDSAKPATVSNFLAYVDSDRYKRTLLHRLVPGFIVQGGAGTIANPYSGSLFEIVNAMETDPAITNEFDVGPTLSNEFGTLAMAKIENEPHSATSSWFFNLGNNSTNLDTQNGGFTVFGRAVAGTNLFKTFNSLSYWKGIIPVSDFFNYGIYCGFIYLYEDGEYTFFPDGNELPVSFVGSYCVRYSDLLVVDVFRLDSSNTDTTPPTVSIQTPAANATVTSSSIELTGTAADNEGVASVDVILNHERLVVAAGTDTWIATHENVLPGTNTFTVVAIDGNGNQSKPVFRNVFYLVQEALNLTKVGEGTVSGVSEGQMLDLGRNYTISATPAAGYLFQSWTGNVSGLPSTSPSLTFTMKSNAAISAVFVPDPFIAAEGTYNGLFSETNTSAYDRVGYFTMKLTDRGTYSGKLSVEGSTIPFKGQFNPDGTINALVNRSGTNFLSVSMNIVTNGSCQITGRVSKIVGTTWSAPLIADQATFNAKLNPAPQIGQYTLVLPGNVGSPTEPGGNSHGTIKIDGNGKVTFVGLLADGTKMTQKTVLSKDGNWPFFGSLYKGKGVAFGWLQFVSGNPETDILGEAAWFKSAAAGGTYYPGGFAVRTEVVGSTFVKPASSTTRIIELSSGVVSFSGGDLPSDFDNNVTISEKSSVTTSDPNTLKMTFSKGNGLMKGVVVHPGGVPTVKFSGVVVQKLAAAAGFFLGVDESGEVLLTAP